MSVQMRPFARRASLVAIEEKIAADRRRHRRVPLDLMGRFMRANKVEYPCKLIDISVGGASIASPVGLYFDERVVVYFDELGGLEGTVVRSFDDGFAMVIRASAHKREKLAAKITWLINRHNFEGLEARRHDRIALNNKFVELRLPDGESARCRLLDISLSGASVETAARPPLGSEVILGKQFAVVRRHHDTGIGVQFVKEYEPEALRRFVG